MSTSPLLTLSQIEEPDDLPKKPSTDFSSMPFPLMDRWGSHPGFGLTPRRINDIYQTAEYGRPMEQCDLFDDVIESDATLRSQLTSILEAVSGKQWIMQAGGDSPEDIAAAQILEGALRAIPNIKHTIEHQFTADWYGYAASEIVWNRDENGAIVPTWFANVPHRRIVFDKYDRPHLLQEGNIVNGEPLAPGKWLYSQARGRIAAASGIMRTAVWWSMFKRRAMRDWVIRSERFGIPFVLGTYPDNLPADEKANLKKAVAAIGTDGSATMNEAAKIIMTSADGGASDSMQGALISLCNAEMNKLINGAMLTSESPTQGGGSYALGKVHADTRYDRVMSRAEEISLRFEQDVSIPFVHFNGLKAKPPRMKIAVMRDMDPATRMAMYDAYKNKLGGVVDDEQVRQDYNFKKPGPGSVALEGPPPAPAPPLGQKINGGGVTE